MTLEDMMVNLTIDPKTGDYSADFRGEKTIIISALRDLANKLDDKNITDQIIDNETDEIDF